MKKTITVILGLIIISIFASLVYNSKREDYETLQNFYKKDFNGRIVEIKDGRGSRIYYNSEDFFDTSFCDNTTDIEEIIKVGDVIKKNDSIIKFYRVDEDFNSTEISSSTVIKSADTYFTYFFN